MSNIRMSNSDQIEAIERDNETKTLVLSSDGYAALEESKNENKPYLFIKEYNDSWHETIPDRSERRKTSTE